MRYLLLFVLSIATLHTWAADDIEIRCGLIRPPLKFIEDPVWEWKEEEGYGPIPTLEEGETFAVVLVIMKKADRSISKYDYSLGGSPCLAMAKDLDPFSPAFVEEIFEGTTAVKINLIYKVDSQLPAYNFEFSLRPGEPPISLPNPAMKQAAPTPAPADPVDEEVPEGADDAAEPEEDDGGGEEVDAGEE